MQTMNAYPSKPPAFLARSLMFMLVLLGATPGLRADWFATLVTSDTDEMTRTWSHGSGWHATSEWARHRTYNARYWANNGSGGWDWDQATVYVYGPGRVDFDWAIDAGPNATFEMRVNGVTQTTIYGSTGSNTRSVAFSGTGLNTLSWIFYNNLPVAGPQWVYLHDVRINHQPDLYQYPQGSYARDGQTVSVSARARGNNMSYNWYDQYGNYVTGGQNTSFSMNANRTRMRLVASNGYGVNAEAWFDNYLVQTPVITSHPQNQLVGPGQTAYFSVSASNYQLNYQWYKNGNSISGANSPYLYLYNVQSSDAANYSCYVWNSAGSVWSSAATLTVATPPVITVQPVSISRSLGQSATFSVTATGTTPAYQWHKNSNVISGATSSSYTIPSVQLSDGGAYQVKVSNAAGTVWSSNAVLTPLVAPAITVQPASVMVNPGETANFTVTATGTPLNYQWAKGDSAISGETNASLTIPSALLSDSGDYTVTVSNELASVTSAVAVPSPYRRSFT